MQTMMLNSYATYEGADYLIKCLKRPLEDVMDLLNECEIDPSKLPTGDEAQLASNIETLSKCTLKFIDSIVNSKDEMPNSIRVICRFLNMMMADISTVMESRASASTIANVVKSQLMPIIMPARGRNSISGGETSAQASNNNISLAVDVAKSSDSSLFKISDSGSLPRNPTTHRPLLKTNLTHVQTNTFSPAGSNHSIESSSSSVQIKEEKNDLKVDELSMSSRLRYFGRKISKKAPTDSRQARSLSVDMNKRISLTGRETTNIKENDEADLYISQDIGTSIMSTDYHQTPISSDPSPEVHAAVRANITTLLNRRSFNAPSQVTSPILSASSTQPRSASAGSLSMSEKVVGSFLFLRFLVPGTFN